MNGRVYDPLVARFLSADPIIQDPEHSQSYNRYSYVWNNPTNLTDPTGFLALTQGNRTVIYNEETVDTCAKGSTCYKDDGGGIHVITQIIDTDSKGRTTSADMTGGAGRNSSSPDGLKHRAEQLKNVVDHIERLEANLRPKSWSEAGAGLQMHDQKMHFQGAFEETVRKWRQVTPWSEWSKKDKLDAFDDALLVLGSRMGGRVGARPDPVRSLSKDMLRSPVMVWGKSVEEIVADFRAAGYEASPRPSNRGSGLAVIIEVKGHPEISQIQVHPGGGRHEGAYVKISTTSQGTVKVVGPGYKGGAGEKATIHQAGN